MNNLDPKEKAKELVEKFGGYKTETGFVIVNIERAKQCALICVDEILETHKTLYEQNTNEYWRAVKLEITKL